jgi:hypothetical protein
MLSEEKKDTLVISRRLLGGLDMTKKPLITYECMTPTNIAPSKLKDISNFQLLAQVGEGALGKVYKALHTSS